MPLWIGMKYIQQAQVMKESSVLIISLNIENSLSPLDLQIIA